MSDHFLVSATVRKSTGEEVNAWFIEKLGTTNLLDLSVKFDMACEKQGCRRISVLAIRQTEPPEQTPMFNRYED